MSVRSAAQISSPRNGLSICRIIVFGIIGRAMPAGIGLRIRSTCRVSRRMRHRRAKQLRQLGDVHGNALDVEKYPTQRHTKRKMNRSAQ
jgi:hypothetical protein